MSFPLCKKRKDGLVLFTMNTIHHATRIQGLNSFKSANDTVIASIDKQLRSNFLATFILLLIILYCHSFIIFNCIKKLKKNPWFTFSLTEAMSLLLSTFIFCNWVCMSFISVASFTLNSFSAISSLWSAVIFFCDTESIKYKQSFTCTCLASV